MTFELTVPIHALNEATYAANVVLREALGQEFDVRGVEADETRLTGGGRALSMPASFFGSMKTQWLDKASLPVEPLHSWELPPHLAAAVGQSHVPVVYGARSPSGRFAEPMGADGYLGLDVLGTAFFFLSRYEEAVEGAARDRHERFPARASLAARADLVQRPIVNEYVEILWATMQQVWPDLVRPRRVSRRFVSHDIDRAFQFRHGNVKGLVRMMAVDLIQRRSLRAAARRPLQYASVRRGNLASDPCATWEWLMDECDRAGLKTTFFFLIDGPGTPFGSDYDHRDPAVTKVVKRIAERGHDVGLHAGYWTLGDRERLRDEVRRFTEMAETAGVRQDGFGCRQHVLRWRPETTPADQESVGLAYDTSLGFAEAPGFRAGFCYDYALYDLPGRRELKVRERPLIVMDTSLLSRKYMGMAAGAKATATALQVRAKVEHFNGDFVLLWHNSKLRTAAEMEMFATLLR